MKLLKFYKFVLQYATIKEMTLFEKIIDYFKEREQKKLSQRSLRAMAYLKEFDDDLILCQKINIDKIKAQLRGNIIHYIIYNSKTLEDAQNAARDFKTIEVGNMDYLRKLCATYSCKEYC